MPPETRRSLSGSKGDDTEGLPIPKEVLVKRQD
jgi:hypothetical protein